MNAAQSTIQSGRQHIGQSWHGVVSLPSGGEDNCQRCVRPSGASTVRPASSAAGRRWVQPKRPHAPCTVSFPGAGRTTKADREVKA